MLSVHLPKMSIFMVRQQSPTLSRLIEEEWEHHCPQNRYKRRRKKSKELSKLLKSLPRLPSHIEPTLRACLLRISRSLRYGDLRMGKQPLQTNRLQSQNPRCLPDYHQGRIRILQQTHLHLRQIIAPLRSNNLLKTHISIKEPWHDSGKLVFLSLALA